MWSSTSTKCEPFACCRRPVWSHGCVIAPANTTLARGLAGIVGGVDPVSRRYTDEILDIGTCAGLDSVGVAPATTLWRTRAALIERRAAGLHADMKFTYLNPERSTEPTRVVAGARAIVVGARSYLEADPVVAESARAYGEVARYAWRDHYAPLRDSLRTVARQLKADGYKAVVIADDNGLVDREVAYLAGIGWYGKNANLLLPGRGSWYVLGAVVTTAPLVPAPEPVADGCGACRRCLDACPTAAIIAQGVIDANRCLAWIVQRPGTVPLEYRTAIGTRVYGCDDCQDVCPPNVRFGRPRRSHSDTMSHIDLVWLLDAPDTEILDLVGQWYIADRDLRWLRRNALVALGNVGNKSVEAIAALERYRLGPDELLAEHAAWALGQ